MKNTYVMSAIILPLFAGLALAQQPPPRPQGPPGDGPHREGQGGPGGGRKGGPQDDWMKRLDTNGDGKLDLAELQASLDSSFAAWDKNGNGTIDQGEMPRPPRPPQPPPGERGERPQGRQNGQPETQGMRPDGLPMGKGDGQHGRPEMNGEGQKMLPPFFFADRNPEGSATSKTDFEKIAKGVFAEMDKNGDGFITKDEARPPRREGGPKGPPRPEGPPMPPNARFIGAELRFGDKLVTGQPFSADIVIEDLRRLYDGTAVTKQNKGAIYRDGNGRTRREQPLEMVGGVNIVGSDNKPQTLVFINDFAAKSQVFLDGNNKVARKSRIGGNSQSNEPRRPYDAKTEALGTKMIEGVKAEGTRVTFEIPTGQLGNDKPIQVVSEEWFSPELQVIVLSRHVDPVAGEHLFKLVNIKRSEPIAELFNIPSGYRIENQADKRHQD